MGDVRCWTAGATLLLAVALPLVGPPLTAAAHERLLSIDPMPAAIVTAPVTVIRLTFSDTISPGFAAATFAVDDQPARPITATIDGATLIVRPPDPAPATRQRWTLSYRIVSRDGHPVVDQVAFTVAPTDPSPGTDATPVGAPTAQSPAGRLPQDPVTSTDATPERRWPIAVGAATVIVIVAMAARRSRLPGARGQRGQPR